MKTRLYFFFFSILILLFFSKTAFAQISVDFSSKRGYYKQSFDLTINTSGYNVSVRYTLDGSEPNASYGIVPLNSNTFTIANINSTTVVRVYAYNIEESTSITHTYIFTEDVFKQNNDSVINSLSYPSQWGYGKKDISPNNNTCIRQAADYDMNLDCFTNVSDHLQELEAGLKEIPAMAISLDKSQIFGSDSGIYIFPLEKSDVCFTVPQDVHSWERKASIEIFNDINDTLGFNVNAGLKISGGSTRGLHFYKHSFKLKFRSEYGAGKLKYPLFGDDATDRFESLQLRMVGHCSPHDWSDSRRWETQFHKDGWAKYIQRELSGKGTSANSRFFHLFINGLYWGIYDVTERPDQDYMASYYGGEPEDYNVIKINELKNGTDSVYKYMHDLGHSIYDTITDRNASQIIVNENRAVNFYAEINELLDIEKFIDYNLMNYYLVNTDWDDNNWWAASSPKQNLKFQFFVWDAEWILFQARVSNPSLQTAGNSGSDFKYHPIDLNHRLLDVPEYKIKFGDHIQCHCVEPDGILRPQNLIESYKSFEQKIHKASMLEFARWGDARKIYPPYTPVCHDIVDEVLNKYETDIFPNLLTYMLLIYGNPTQEFKLYPNFIKKVYENRRLSYKEIYNFKAVEFSQLGGEVRNGYELILTNPNNQPTTIGDIYYTTDGSDPRNIDGKPSATAIKYTGPIIIDEFKRIKARVYAETFNYTEIENKVETINDYWTAMCPRDFFPEGYYDNLVINEIHYHPADLGDVSGSNLEFLEIKNTGSTINISNIEFSEGIHYQFPMGTIIPSNGFILLAADSTAAKNYYGVTVDGQYKGKLANNGELISLKRTDGAEIDIVRYDDNEPWDDRPDGGGPSLGLYLDKTEENHLATSWASSADGCSPKAENVFCAPMTFNITSANPTCYNGDDGFINIGVSGGAPPMSVLWSNDITTNLISNLVSGTYEVTITDAEKCFETKSITITNPELINSNLEITHTTNAANSNGVATINPENVPYGYTVEWSNGITGDVNSNLSLGNYSVKIVDFANPNCFIINNFVIEEQSSCSMPTNLSAMPTSERTAVVTWSGNQDNTSYELSYRIYGESNWNNITTNSTGLLLNNLEACTAYEYKVSATCNTVNSNSTTIKNLYTSGCNNGCNANEVNGNVVNVTNTSAFILWDIIPNATYRLNYRKSGANSWKEYETHLNLSILFGLDNCTNYEWYIDVVCPNGTIHTNAANINTFETSNCLRKTNQLTLKSDKNNFTLYPNPAHDFIVVSSNDTEQLSASQILVYDYAGRLVKNGGSFINGITLNIEDLKSGMYVAQIANKSQNLQYKFRKK